MNHIKILFSGPMGAGKTTAIAAVSDIPPLGTEVPNSDPSECAKETTTVALDYGELSLASGQKVKLFGAPGQDRFAFLRRSLANGALGVVVLIDNSRSDPGGDLSSQISSFQGLLAAGRVVVGIGRTHSHPMPSVEQHAAMLKALGADAPVFSVDVRQREDVLLLLDAMLCQIEVLEDLP